MPFHPDSKPEWFNTIKFYNRRTKKVCKCKSYLLSALNNNLLSELLWNSDLFQFSASQWILQILIWIWLHTIKTNYFPRVYEAIYYFTSIASWHNLPVQKLLFFFFHLLNEFKQLLLFQLSVIKLIYIYSILGIVHFFCYVLNGNCHLY